MAVRDRGVSHLGESVGLTDEQLIEMYRLVALARVVDERLWVLNRAGRIPFVISGQGHEGAQVAIAWALEKGKDWIAPYYRSIATCLTFGMSASDILIAQYAKASDPSSGGRQMPGHYGSREHNIVSVSSPVYLDRSRRTAGADRLYPESAGDAAARSRLCPEPVQRVSVYPGAGDFTATHARTLPQCYRGGRLSKRPFGGNFGYSSVAI
jgi:hypothetical protein